MDITLAGSAVAYTPNEDELVRVSLEFAAFDGEVGTGQLPVPDPAAGLTVATGRQAKVEEIGALLTDGFIIDQDRVRGPEPAGSAREYTFSVMDANALLHGFRVELSRSAETDYARVMAFAALYGPTWDTTWVLNSNTVTLPVKTYATSGGFDELITDCAEFTGKTLFLHDKALGGRCLHYHLLTTGHTSGLTISDVPSAVDGITVFAPQSPVRQRTSVDLVNDVKGRDQSGRVSTVTDATSITAHDVDGLKHQGLIDFETTSQADLNAKTAAFLASQKDDQDTYSLAIGPLDATALSKIRVGDYIPTTSSVLGLTASAQRIAHMTLTVYAVNGPPAPGLWNAALELGAPVRRRARVKAGPGLAATVAPYLAVPPYTPTPCLDAWDSFDDRATLIGSEDWDSTSADSIPWLVKNVNNGGDLPDGQADGWVSGGIGYLRSGYVAANGLPIAWVESGPSIGATDWEVLFRFRIVGTVPVSCTANVAIAHQIPPTSVSTPVAYVIAPGGTVTPLVIPTHTWYLCRFGRENAGPSLRWKTWPDGAEEPAAWLDTASVVAVDAFGFVLNATGSTAGFAELHIDWVDFGDGCLAFEPVSGQHVPHTLGVSDGTTTAYRTRSPYMVGSLQVYADDIREWNITETDPTTGDWAFDTAPFSGETIRAEYRAG